MSMLFSPSRWRPENQRDPGHLWSTSHLGPHSKESGQMSYGFVDYSSGTVRILGRGNHPSKGRRGTLRGSGRSRRSFSLSVSVINSVIVFTDFGTLNFPDRWKIRWMNSETSWRQRGRELRVSWRCDVLRSLVVRVRSLNTSSGGHIDMYRRESLFSSERVSMKG